MVAEPADTPCTMPVALTVAFVVEPLDQTPPEVVSVIVMLADTHTDDVPVIVPATAVAFTVTACTALSVPQLLVTVYNMLVTPAVLPKTLPLASTVATVLLSLLHDPLPAASNNEIDEPVQTDATPDMLPAFGKGLTVKG